jgi:hypothetical protein
VAQRAHDRVAAEHRHHDTDHRDAERSSAHLPELAEVHLEADAEQEEDHAELTEHGEGLVAPDEAEDRRSDHDAGDDLADHRGDVDALGDLRRDLRSDEHDEDVEQHRGDVHGQ